MKPFSCKLMSFMGDETVYDHADYRLVWSKVLKSFCDFKEVNIFLRGMFPFVGCLVALLSFIGILWSVIVQLTGNSVAGWTSLTSILCFLGGVQLVSLGIIGEYVGKIYLETKGRLRFIISEKNEDEDKNN